MPPSRALASALLVAVVAVVAAAAVTVPPDAHADIEFTGFIVAHSHCDAGWRLTLEEYYEESVRAILTSSIEALQRNSTRRFIWAETVYFAMWFEEQTEETRAIVRDLIASGRLEMVEGGWVMSDEASADPYSRINQMTLGHEYLQRTVGARPRIGWQIDPFGDSSITPLLYRQMGYSALVNDRISLRLKEARMDTKELQFLWKDAPSAGVDAELFTHTLDSWYWQPSQFNWDEGAAPVDERNIDTLASQLVAELRTRSKYFRTPHVLYPFGHDFAFEDAHIMYDNMDQLIDYVNARPERFKAAVRYSTLSEFFDTVMSTGTAWPQFSEDYLPFEDVPWGHFWVGHYTSRPLLKRRARTLDHALRVAETARTLAALHSGIDLTEAPVEQARRTSALMNHHDAITGTARELVVQDYMAKIEVATGEAERTAARALSTLAYGKPDVLVALNSSAPTLHVDVQRPRVLVAYNSLGWTRRELLEVAIEGDLDDASTLLVADENGDDVEAQVVQHIDVESGALLSRLFVELHLPPLGYRTLRIAVVAEANATTITRHVDAIGDVVVESATCSFTVAGSDGTLREVRDLATGTATALEQDFAEYNSSIESGAYLFFPEGPAERVNGPVLSVTVARGPLVAEVRSARRVSNNQIIEQSLRVAARAATGDRARTAWLRVSGRGAIGENKELVVRLRTKWATAGRLYTDNGIFVKERTYDASWESLDPIGSNYKPIIAMAALKVAPAPDQPFDRLSVISAEAHGVASLEDGLLEVMLQRRLMQDDGLGLNEGCDDHAPFVADFALLIDSQRHGALPPRRRMIEHNQPVALFATNTDPISPSVPLFAGLSDPLADEVHLTSFEIRDDVDARTVVVRFNHLLEATVDGWGSADVVFPLDGLFAGLSIEDATYVSLNLAQELGDFAGNVTLAPGAFASLLCIVS